MFDLDGTLIDTEELILSSARHATEKVLGEALPDDVLRHNIGVPLRGQMEEYAPGHVDGAACGLPRAQRARPRRADSRVPGRRARRSRPSRSAGIPMGDRDLEEPACRAAGARLLRARATSSSSSSATRTPTIHKPEAESGPRGGASAGRARPSECIYVGDSPHDMAAGIAAGALTAAAMWGPFAERVLEPGPDFALEQPGRPGRSARREASLGA